MQGDYLLKMLQSRLHLQMGGSLGTQVFNKVSTWTTGGHWVIIDDTWTDIFYFNSYKAISQIPLI